MLETLISSKIKRRVLSTLLSNPAREYYLRELASVCHVSVGSLHRELNKLEKEKILVSHHLGNLRYFSCNKENPWYNELKRIIVKAAEEGG